MNLQLLHSYFGYDTGYEIAKKYAQNFGFENIKWERIKERANKIDAIDLNLTKSGFPSGQAVAEALQYETLEMDREAFKHDLKKGLFDKENLDRMKKVGIKIPSNMAKKKATKQLPLFPASEKKTEAAKPKKKRVRQTGKSNIFHDVFYKALPPGKRISKKSGDPYYEYRKNRSDKPGQLTGIGTMDYFDVRNIQSLDQLKKEYYKLAKKYHPDAGGSESAFKALQAEYEELTNNYLKYGNFTNKEKQVEVEIDERYMAVVNEIMKIPGIDVEIVGSWIWVSGMTYPVKDELKKLGFMFAPLKKMWYINTTGTKTKKGKEMDIDSIRKKYGTKKFTRDGGSYIEGINGPVKISPLQKRKFKLAMSKLIKALQKRKPSANG